MLGGSVSSTGRKTVIVLMASFIQARCRPGRSRARLLVGTRRVEALEWIFGAQEGT